MRLTEPIYRQEEGADETWGLQDLEASILPKSGDMDNYDFILSLKDPEHDNFFGIFG